MKLLQTLKEKLPKKLFTKKSLIIIAVVAVIGGFAAFKLWGGKEIPVMTPEIRTTVLNKTSLVNAVSVSGTVKSIDVVNVTTSLAYKVTEILVQVGDSVKKGDIIAKLDSADLQKSINEEKKKLSEAKSTAQDALNKTITKKDESEDAVAKAENDCSSTKKSVDAAYAPYSVAKNSIAVAQQGYDIAFADQSAKGLAMNSTYGSACAAADAKFSNAKAAVDAADATLKAIVDAVKAYTDAKSAYDAEADLEAKKIKEQIMNSAETAMKAAKLTETAATTAKTAADAALVTAETERASAKTAYDNAKVIYDASAAVAAAAKTTLDTAKTASNFDAIAATYKAADTADEVSRAALAAAKKLRDADVEAYKAAQKAFDNAGTSTVLEDLVKKVEDCTIKAETSGVITAINAVVGSAMGQSANAGTGPLAVIQDTDNLIISTSFKEYDIPNIEIGQKVTIKSDATGEKVINGYVSQISMTAASGQNGEVSFPAEIRIETPDSGLLVGMNAKANVILSQKDNIYVVPDDAIGMNEKGEKVVYLQNGEAFEPIVVTTGVSNDFYTEIISSKLTEGCVIRSNASEAGSMMMGGSAAGGDMAAAGGMAGGSVVMSVG